MKKEDFFSELKNDFSSDDEKERIKILVEIIDIKNGEELPKLNLKSNVILFTCFFGKIVTVSFTEFEQILYFV